MVSHVLPQVVNSLKIHTLAGSKRPAAPEHFRGPTIIVCKHKPFVYLLVFGFRERGNEYQKSSNLSARAQVTPRSGCPIRRQRRRCACSRRPVSPCVRTTLSASRNAVQKTWQTRTIRTGGSSSRLASSKFTWLVCHRRFLVPGDRRWSINMTVCAQAVDWLVCEVLT